MVAAPAAAPAEEHQQVAASSGQPWAMPAMDDGLWAAGGGPSAMGAVAGR